MRCFFFLHRTPAAQLAAAAAAQINSKLGMAGNQSAGTDIGAAYGVPQSENMMVPYRFVGLRRYLYTIRKYLYTIRKHLYTIRKYLYTIRKYLYTIRSAGYFNID